MADVKEFFTPSRNENPGSGAPLNPDEEAGRNEVEQQIADLIAQNRHEEAQKLREQLLSAAGTGTISTNVARNTYLPGKEGQK